MLEKVAEDISAGYSMAQSFENNMHGLPKTFIETVRAGEQSGALEECFKRLHRYYDKSAKTKVINTMTYRRIFDIARLVDPGICVELTKRDEGYTLKKSEHCYAVWKKKRRCENCISQEVLRTHKPQTKLETRESDIYYVLASFIEVDGRPYSLELVKRIKSDDMFERENVLNQLLVRNWQVYMDSVTKVYNRRYYDERLKNLEGRFSFAMIDMDNFKHINDRFGHQAGDAALYRAAQTIKSQIRSDDELVRYGAMNSSCCSATCRSRSWRRNCSPSAPRLTRSSSRSILNCTSARASAATTAKPRRVFRTTSASCASLICSRATTACKT